MSKDKYLCIFLKPNGGYLIVFIILQIFFHKTAFWETFFKGLKRPSNSVRAQNVVSLFKMFSSIHFDNLLGIKTKRANVKRKVRKLGHITWGISSLAHAFLNCEKYSYVKP